jgi:hypothetical protein
VAALAPGSTTIKQQDADCLLKSLHAFSRTWEAHAELPKLRLHIAHAQAEHQPSAADTVDIGGHPRE